MDQHGGRGATGAGLVRVELLGPMVVRGANGTRVSLPGGRARTLLACLAVRPGPTSVGVLVDDLWPGGEIPRSPRHALENHVSRLRGSLRTLDAGEVVVHSGGGYDLHRTTTDAEDLEALAAEGRAAARSGDVWSAAAQLRCALALWRGEPLEGLPSSHLFTTVAARLCRTRRRARDLLFDTELALGLHDDLVDELSRDLEDDPLDERRRGQLMLALYRAGRPAAALQAFHQGADELRRELGVDPSVELQRLYVGVLRQDVPPTAPALPPTRHGPDPAVGPSPRRRPSPARHVPTPVADSAAGQVPRRLNSRPARTVHPRSIG